MLVSLVVIGEVSGRWKTRLASERESLDVPATLNEITALGWEFKDYGGTSFPVKIELLANKSEYPPLARARKRDWMDRLIPPTYLKLSCQIEYSDTDALE